MWQYNYNNHYQDELYHYGREGMKWYQHVYGTIKKAYSSKRRSKKNKKLSQLSERELKKKINHAKLENEYRDLRNKKSNKTNSNNQNNQQHTQQQNNQQSQQHNTATKPKPTSYTLQKRPVDQMSNADIDAYLERQKKEKAYISSISQTQKSAGRKFAESLFDEVLVPVAKEQAKNYLNKKIGTMLNTKPKQDNNNKKPNKK